MTEEKDLNKEQLDRCIPVAKQILDMLGKYDNKLMGQVSQSDLNVAYKDLVTEIKKLFLEKDLQLNDINFVMSLVVQPIDAVKFIISENFNKLLKDAQFKFWGKDNDDVTVGDLDKLFK